MSKGLFVTGTDTNVGKTVLSALLVAALDGIYWKPIQTGASEGTDREAVTRWAAISEERTLPECYCFDPPVSPHLAAEMSGATIELGRIRWPQGNCGRPVIAEGAGGVMVPLNDREFMLDVARHLAMPVVVASRTALGTINHTTLTVNALHDAGIAVLGVVMIGAENKENERAIEKYGAVSVVGRIPPLETIHREALLRVFRANFDAAVFAAFRV